MRKLALLGTLVLSFALAAVAYGQVRSQGSNYSGKVSVAPNKKGSAKKPVGVRITTNLVGKAKAAGQRPAVYNKLVFTVDGVRQNSKSFPKCTVEQIESAQSADKCPKGSKIAQGEARAVIGPETDPSNAGVPCVKTVSIYNAGANKGAYFLTGPGSACAGLTYAPPAPISWSKGGKAGTKFTFNIPANVYKPLPGVSGVVSSLKLDFNGKAAIKGKRTAFFQSTSCPRAGRSLVWTVSEPANAAQGSRTVKYTEKAGKCK